MSLVSTVVNDTMIIENLPNLKIEIENDLDGKMDTDDENYGSCGKALGSVPSEAEEGELVDDDDDDEDIATLLTKTKNAIEPVSCPVPAGRSILKYDTKEYAEPQTYHNAVRNPNGGFVTGVDIFSPEEQAKLDKRALRFGIEASESKVMTEKLLKKLYKSMDVNPSDETIRLDALHMRGTEQMVTQDVFNYFKDYGPASLEWITDNSCNVVWLESISAARALLGLSVHVRGQGGLENGGERGKPTRHRSSLSDSDVEMVSETQTLTTDKPAEDDTECLSEESDACDIDSLGVDLPAGRWRRGAPDPLSLCVLLRFATTSDRSQPKRQEYTKYGNHSFGGYMGLISESRKRRLQGIVSNPIFEDVGDEILPKPALEETDSSNPWGMLAKTWSRFDKVRKPRPPSPVIQRILPLPPRMTPPPSPPSFLTNRVRLVPRTRMRREREMTVRHISDPEPSGSSDGEEWSLRSKVPRMRMHADDEEKKRGKRVKHSHRSRIFSDSPPRRDIRHRIGASRPTSVDKSSPEPVVEEPDNEKEIEENEEGEEEIPDLRVAVPAERSSSPDETKEDLRERLFNTAGNIKSVLRGARGHSNDEDEEEEEGEAEEESRRHQSRQTERRKQHRKHKESSYHKSRRREESDSDSNDMSGKLRSTIRRKSPDGKEKKEYVEERKSRHEMRAKSPSRRRRRKEDEHRRQKEEHRRSDRVSRRHGGDDSRVSKDLRLKIAHNKTYDFDNEFRSKSPLQIEIDNDEYYNKNSNAESD